MGSSKKHKKNKSERREKYEEFSNNMDPSQMQRGLKLILKVGSNSTPEYNSESALGPPTAVEAMMSAAPSSPAHSADGHIESEYRERHKKSKKKKKKKDREKKHKHHKEKRHRGERHGSKTRDAASSERHPMDFDDTATNAETPTTQASSTTTAAAATPVTTNSGKSAAHTITLDGDSSQDDFSFMDDESMQPLPENILFYAGITTENSPSYRPVSKPIVPRKVDDLLLGSPASSSMGGGIGTAGGTAETSPTKPLPDLLIPSPCGSVAASTPGGASLTPKALEAPKTPSSSSESGREPRTCVLKLKQQKSPLNKLLDHLLRLLEKRDPHQFFAWPVTDDIAPGYSSIITKPMDFSTMRQKIDDSEYSSLMEFTDDFKLMCDNAIRYNHVDTVYHKAAKRLMQVGMKHLQPENLMRSLKPPLGYMRELTLKELGFEMMPGDLANTYDQHGGSLLDSADEGASTGADEPTPAQLEEEEKRRAIRLENQPKTRYEPYVDDLTAEEVLAQVQGAARAAKKRLSSKEKAHKMGFLRQRKDGTTSLNLLLKEEVEGPERVVNLGEIVGKLESGSGQLYAPVEDKRNQAKFVKPLHYGSFASFAPVFDSRFSNLSKEETQLVMNSYGDATCVEYAESILQFTKDSSYASQLANGLLDILTQGEHSKAMADLYNMQVQNYEENVVHKCFSSIGDERAKRAVKLSDDTREQIEEDFEKYKNTRIDFQRLRTLTDLGIEMDFLDEMETEMKNYELSRRLQEHLSNNLNLIEKLRNTQNERLSQPLPHHLAHVPHPGTEEQHLAQQITQQLSDLAKKLPPSAVADPYSLRKAMGMSYVGLAAPPQPASNDRINVPELLQQPVEMPQLNIPPTPPPPPPPPQTTRPADEHTTNLSHMSATSASNGGMPMDIDEDAAGGGASSTSGVDLENELREFLESGTAGLHASGSVDDSSNIVAQLLM